MSWPELLSPAGNWDCARAAVENGADAIYFGLELFNARMRADNFTLADLPDLIPFLHQRGVKGYVTFNTLVFPAELEAAEHYLRQVIVSGVDAAIVQDIGICRLIRHLSSDFPIHASTQMTITSQAGVEFAETLGCQRVVLARECSLTEIQRIHTHSRLPLEVFVHGALCVAYSGQCLTSEALGGRSANRGECAQACRMPYTLIADGSEVPLGDRHYLLSPQDLAGLDLIPQLLAAGVTSLKIEGRLKTPEYVASVTRIYRKALDNALLGSMDRSQSCLSFPEPSRQDRYELEMSFSRGLYTGWLQGIDNQSLVHARFGKKRGVYLGQVTQIKGDRIQIRLVDLVPLKVGDGVVFDAGQPDKPEEGGRIHTLDPVKPLDSPQKSKEFWLGFGKGSLRINRIHPGDRVWKTSDPELEKQIRKTYTAPHPQYHRPLDMSVFGSEGTPLLLVIEDELGHRIELNSVQPLQLAQKHPLTRQTLEDQLGRLGNTGFYLRQLTSHLQASLMLPMSELNRLRRQGILLLEQARKEAKPWDLNPGASVKDLLSPILSYPSEKAHSPELIVLVRHLSQLQAVIQAGIQTVYCELEDPRQYREAVQWVKQNRVAVDQTLWLAPPRITKPGETWILEQVRKARADGYLIRNYDQGVFFAGERCVGDFSLNVANPLSADFLKHRFHLERVTASYDLNIQQLESLLQAVPGHWIEVTLHQHMPMFHMEHCVFCAFLSQGTDYTNCGRPCEKYTVKLRDRVGAEHTLKADAGCRNTVFNSKAQTGAEYTHRLLAAGAAFFRIEFLDESPQDLIRILNQYQQLLRGQLKGSQIWQHLNLHSQLGVTRGTVA
jgi:putative protease